MHDIEPAHLQVEISGRPKIDNLATQRASENPPNRDCVCQSCGTGTAADDLWRMTWSYFFVPNRAIAVLVPIAAAMGAAFVHNYTREVRHNTYHILCPGCAAEARRRRMLGAVLEFIGLFLAICGFALTVGGACWWSIANSHDRRLVQTWIAIPIGAFVLGVVVRQVGLVNGVPAIAKPLLRRPFCATSFKHVGGPAAT
jgi:hypothetical protein